MNKIENKRLGSHIILMKNIILDAIEKEINNIIGIKNKSIVVILITIN